MNGHVCCKSAPTKPSLHEFDTDRQSTWCFSSVCCPLSAPMNNLHTGTFYRDTYMYSTFKNTCALNNRFCE